MNILLVIGIMLGGWALTALIVVIMNLFDPSPTRDDECRGGHDF